MEAHSRATEHHLPYEITQNTLLNNFSIHKIPHHLTSVTIIYHPKQLLNY